MAEQPGFWDQLSLALGIGASTAGLVAAAAGVTAFGVRQWRKTIGRRQAQSAILDQLACGSPLAFVEARLGLPKYITGSNEGPGVDEERIYRLPSAWVTVQAPKGVVEAYSITITDPKMYYETGPLTLGIVSVKLGQDTFADAPPSDSETTEIYARFTTFVRYYDYGAPAAGYQYVWLAFNDAGAGNGNGIGASDNRYRNGVYAADSQDSTPSDYSAITVNTITVGTYTTRDQLNARGVHGPHRDSIRHG